MDFEIRRWNASYYVGPLRKWVYGHLSVYPNGISFHDESKKPALTKDLTIKFEEFAFMKKASSSFIFSAITVVDNKRNTHWFASFQDRVSVFSALNHFFLNAVTQRDCENVKALPDGRRTKLGSTLLRIATDSEQTLQQAATRLALQREQIDNSLATMDDVHNDLDVASDIVSGLEAWLGRWHMPKKYLHVDPVILKDQDVPQVFDYEMLYSKIDNKKFHSQKAGVVRISADGVTVLDLQQRVLQLFKWPMVSTIRVVSPWEMVVIQNYIGSADLSYSIVCANMIHVLKKIELFPHGRRRLEYDTCVQQRVLKQDSDSNATRGASTKSSTKTPAAQTASKYSVSDLYGDTAAPHTDQGQMLANKEVISDQEVDQLTATLSNLKAMALAVQVEEDVQNSKLTDLGESVDRANDKLTSTTKRTNRLL